MDYKTDLTGKRFERLVVKERLVTAINGGSLWLCVCDCGGKREVPGSILLNGKLKSCGCLRADRARERQYRHGYVGTPGYGVWSSMKQRCTNPNNKSYKNYGGRGIKICKRWMKFENFLADMGERPSSQHTIERIRNNGNYSPSNCCWALHIRQNNNRRNTKFLTLDGVTQPLTVWARALGIKPKTLRARLDDHGWSVERALSS